CRSTTANASAWPTRPPSRSISTPRCSPTWAPSTSPDAPSRRPPPGDHTGRRVPLKLIMQLLGIARPGVIMQLRWSAVEGEGQHRGTVWFDADRHAPILLVEVAGGELDGRVRVT